jgi:UPF0755 protein
MKKILTLLSLGFLVLFCGAAALAAGGMIWLPHRAEQLFGPPASRLSAFERIYLSAQLVTKSAALNQPKNASGEERPFRVELGEPTSSVISRLAAEGLIADAEAFRAYLQYKALDTTLQAGQYTLDPALTPVEIALSLQDATPSEVDFHILPGWRLEEIAAALPTSGLTFSPEQFQAAAAAVPPGYSFSPEIPPGLTLEGFLFPDSYRLPRDITPELFLQTLLDRFEARLGPSLRQGFARQELSLYEAVTLASIVQREAMNEEEMPLIASVFFNRLAAGTKLESDPTVQYALGYNPEGNTWWTNPLSLAHLEVDSPYNTYRNPGLPPGPIANPSLPALQAVAFPAQTPYFYFRAACDGSGKHVFSETFEEHLGKECP